MDVILTDEVTGQKKIQMLGLDGKYTKVTLGNSPLIRGLSSSYGFTHVPGSWIETYTDYQRNRFCDKWL